MSVFGLDIEYFVAGRRDDGLEKLSVAFERAGQNFQRFGDFMFPKLEKVLERTVAEQFEAEGQGQSRGSWAPLSPAYAKWKARKYPGARKLVATGRLKRALTSSSSGYSERVYTAKEFKFGTRGVPYASFHQTGTARMPDRPVFDFQSDMNRTVERVALEAAREALQSDYLPDLEGA